jgi:hypothetical protein
MMKKIIFSLIFFLMAGLFIWSCIGSKDDLPEPEVDLSLEQDYVTMLSDLNSMQAAVDAAYLNQTNGCGSRSDISDTTGGKYGLFIIDFTGSSCTDTLAGKIYVHYRGSYSKRTLKDTIIFQGFSVNGRSMSGYRARVMSADSSSQIRSFSIYDSDTITFLSGKEYVLQSNTISTEESQANIKTIHGSSSGHAINGDIFSVIINANPVPYIYPTHLISFPLKFDSCSGKSFRYPVSGALTFSNINQHWSRLINFDKRIGKDFWQEAPCGRDTATYISPKGNIYYFSMK